MYNPYIPNYQPNTLPQQQILQANGKQSIDALRLAPNSSVLIADSTAPIVWRCVSDSLGNVTAEAFDISPHKTEEQIQKDSIEQRLSRLEALYEQSIISRDEQSEFSTSKTANTRNKKPTGNVKTDDAE